MSARSLGWPFITLTDQRGAPFGYVAVGGPIRTARHIEVFHQLRARVRFVGFTSYLDFPVCRSTGEPGPDSRPIRAPDISRSCVAWCHCFREPGRYLPAGVPAILLPQSDFIDPAVVATLGSPLGGEEDRPADFDYEYDFVYVCDQGWWKEFAKNWDLARRCLPVLCGELGLKGLLVGRERIDDLPSHVPGPKGSLTVEPLLPWAELLQRFRRSRMVFVSSGMDPSPRVMAEALALDTPVLVNQEILGGWHYVNPSTGRFFSGPGDVAVAAELLLDSVREGTLSPRRWYVEHHGPEHAGPRLARFLKSLDPALAGLSDVGLDYKLGLEEVLAPT